MELSPYQETIPSYRSNSKKKLDAPFSPIPDEAEREFFADLQSLVQVKRVASRSQSFSKICGVDAAYSRSDNRVVAAAVLFIDGTPSEAAIYSGRFTFPYVSGLFYLHEGPFVVAAVKRLKIVPDLVCFDAHGAAHPRERGLATICGAILGLPSIGIAKHKLVGETAAYTDKMQKIVMGGKTVGFVTCSESKKRYWSPGYAINIQELENLINHSSHTCVSTIDSADRAARSELSRDLKS